MFYIIYYVLLLITIIYTAYYLLTSLFALKGIKKKVVQEHLPKHKFGVLIASRNEENVIVSLIESLKRQNYPSDLYEIFVIPNNCDDNTEERARKAGASIINCLSQVRSKGDALKYAFGELQKRDDIDAYLIFDADNVVHPDFIKRMNDALCDGYQVAQGFRDCKNPSDNWLTGSYSLYYYLQNFFLNKSRMYLNGSATLNGTGFVIKKEIVEEYGFNTFTMTEDIEFSAQCALNQIKIVFVEDAITYDEHPSSFVVSWKQRKRWTTGTYQCQRLYSFKLIKNFIKNKNIESFDMLLHFSAPFMQLLSMALGISLFIFKCYQMDFINIIPYAIEMFNPLVILIIYLFNVIINALVVKYYKKQIKDLYLGIILFPAFIISWLPINLICIFKKTKNWEHIKHERNISIESLVN